MCRRVYTYKCKLGYQRDSCFYVSNTYRHWVLRLYICIYRNILLNAPLVYSATCEMYPWFNSCSSRPSQLYSC